MAITQIDVNFIIPQRTKTPPIHRVHYFLYIDH